MLKAHCDHAHAFLHTPEQNCNSNTKSTNVAKEKHERFFKQTLNNLYSDTIRLLQVYARHKHLQQARAICIPLLSSNHLTAELFCNNFPRFSQCGDSSYQDLAQGNAHVRKPTQ